MEDHAEKQNNIAQSLEDNNCDRGKAVGETNISEPSLLTNRKPVEKSNETMTNIFESSNPSSNQNSLNPKVKVVQDILIQLLKMFDRNIFREVNFVLIMIAGACIQASLMSFHQHFVRRAILSGVIKHHAAFLPTCIGIASMVSKVTFGYINSLPQVNSVILYAG